MFTEANTKSSCRVAVAGLCRLWWKVGTFRRPDLHMVTIADGAHDNWRYLNALAPQGTAMVDFYHAAEQLKSGLDV